MTMNVKKIKEILFKKDFVIERDNLDRIGNRRRFRKSYREKYFEGYINDVKSDVNGNAIKQKIYIGDYYKPAITHKQQITHRILVLIIFVLCVVAFILTSTRPIESNKAWSCVVPQILSIIAFFFWGRGMVTWIFVNDRYTISEYRRGVINLRIGSFSASLCLLIASITQFISSVGIDQISNIWISLVLIVAAVIAFLAYYEEKKIVYERVDNPDTPHAVMNSIERFGE